MAHDFLKMSCFLHKIDLNSNENSADFSGCHGLDKQLKVQRTTTHCPYQGATERASLGLNLQNCDWKYEFYLYKLLATGKSL